jgi:hypothetical protein
VRVLSAIAISFGLTATPSIASQEVEVVRLCLSTARYMEAVGQFAKFPNEAYGGDTAQRVTMAQDAYVEDVELFTVVAGEKASAVLAQLDAPLGEYLGKSARCAKFNLCDVSQADGLITLAASLREACRLDFEEAN